MQVRPAMVRLIKVVLAIVLAAVDLYFLAPSLGALMILLGVRASPRLLGTVFLTSLFLISIFCYELISACCAVWRERKDGKDV